MRKNFVLKVPQHRNKLPRELFLLETFKHCLDTFLCHLPRAEPSRAEPSRTEPNPAEFTRARPGWDEPSRVHPSPTGPSRTQPRSPELSRADPNPAGLTRARRLLLFPLVGFGLAVAFPPVSAPRPLLSGGCGRAGHGGAMAGRVRGAHRPGRAALQRCGPGEPLQRRADRAEPAGGRLSPAAAAATRAPGEARPRGRRRGVPVGSSLPLPGAAPAARGNSGRTERTLSFPVL